MSKQNSRSLSEVMEKSSANTEMESHMYEVAMARGYIEDIGGKGPVNGVIWRTFKRLQEMFPHRDNPRNRWTERRLKGFWYGESANVGFREMVELHRAAEAAKAERQLIENARNEHAAFIAKTASLRALLEHQDEDFHSPQIEGLGGVSSRVDSTGTEE